jgi:hypothetical protein
LRGFVSASSLALECVAVTRVLVGLILLAAAEAAAGDGAEKAPVVGDGAEKAPVVGDGAETASLAVAGTGPAALEALVKAAPACEAARAHCVGIRLHVAAADGGLVAAPDWVTRQAAAANEHFAPIGVGFQVVGADALPETAARIEDAQERSALARLVAGTVIDVFVTAQLDDIDVKDGVIRGVAWPAGTKKFVILSTIAPDRTLAHELGHVFGLPHSAYAISIMNKTPRKEPPLEQRTFHASELAVMRGQLARLLREKVIADVPRAAAPAAPATARP